MFRRNTTTREGLQFPNWLLVVALFTPFSLAGPLVSACAGITSAGDVSPSNPSSWTYLTIGYVGSTASGTLTVDGGSDLLSQTCSIGDSVGGSGLVNVSGSGSTWNSALVYVGNSGSGRLSISNAGAVSSNIGYLGYSSGASGTVTVDGPGSTWAVNSYLYAGFSGSGMLSITGGGSVSSGYSYIGKMPAQQAR